MYYMQIIEPEHIPNYVGGHVSGLEVQFLYLMLVCDSGTSHVYNNVAATESSLSKVPFLRAWLVGRTTN